MLQGMVEEKVLAVDIRVSTGRGTWKSSDQGRKVVD